VLFRVTGELRESLAKEAKSYGEKAKKRVRMAREKGMSSSRRVAKYVSCVCTGGVWQG